MDLRTGAGYVLGGLGIVCALVGIFVIDGISIEFPGVILAGLGYYLALTAGDRAGQLLGAVAAVLNVVSMILSGLSGPPQ